MRHLGLATCGASAWALAATVALAQAAPGGGGAPPALLVRAEPCAHSAYDTEAFVRLLTVELAALGVGVEPLEGAGGSTTGTRLDTAPALVTIECGAAPGVLVLRVADLATKKELSRETAVTDVAEDARPRALALAVVALVEASWSETLDAAPTAGPLPVDVRARLRARLSDRLGASQTMDEAVTAATEPTEPPHDPSFEASVALRVFPSRSTALLGLRLSALPRIAARTHLAFDLEASWGESELADAAGSIGTMTLYWLNAGTGIAWRVGERPHLEIGPRVQFGYAHADAHVDRAGARADDDGAFVLSLLASAALRAGPPEGPFATLGLDLGHTPVGIVFLGDQARLSGMADTTLGVRVGVAW